MVTSRSVLAGNIHIRLGVFAARADNSALYHKNRGRSPLSLTSLTSMGGGGGGGGGLLQIHSHSRCPRARQYSVPLGP